MKRKAKILILTLGCFLLTSNQGYALDPTIPQLCCSRVTQSEQQQCFQENNFKDISKVNCEEEIKSFQKAQLTWMQVQYLPIYIVLFSIIVTVGFLGNKLLKKS